MSFNIQSTHYSWTNMQALGFPPSFSRLESLQSGSEPIALYMCARFQNYSNRLTSNFNSLSCTSCLKWRVCVWIAHNNKIKADKTKVNLPFYCFGYRLCALCVLLFGVFDYAMFILICCTWTSEGSISRSRVQVWRKDKKRKRTTDWGREFQRMMRAR